MSGAPDARERPRIVGRVAIISGGASPPRPPVESPTPPYAGFARFGRRSTIAALVLLGLGATGLMCQRVAERGRYATHYSTYGAGEEGTRGLFLLAQELGARPTRWAEDLGRLPEEGGMLVALGSCEQLMRREMTRIDRENLRRWVRAGGVLVVAGVPDYLTQDDFGVELRGDGAGCRPTEGLIGMMARAEERERMRKHPDDAPAEAPTELDDLPGAFADDPVGTYDEVTEADALPEAIASLGVGSLEGMPPVGLRRPLSILVEDELAAHALLRLGGPHGRPVGVRVDVGEGAVIALASASAFQNRDLARERGGVLFARLVREHAAEGPVLFDEYHLGVGERRSMMRYLRQVGAIGLLVQVLLLVLFALWRVGARFGGTRSDPPPEPVGTASYVEGVGTLYLKARDVEGAGQVMVRRALERVASHHRLGSADAASLAAHLVTRRRPDAAQAVEALAALSPERSKGLARFADEVDALVARAIRDDAA